MTATDTAIKALQARAALVDAMRAARTDYAHTRQHTVIGYGSQEKLDAAKARYRAAKAVADADGDLFALSFADLHTLACDLKHPLRREADEILNQWQADDASRRTAAGGEA